MHHSLSDQAPTILAVAQRNYQNFRENDKVNDKRRIDKKTLFCSHCQRNGHTKGTCFLLHGLPDWYKEKKNGKPSFNSKSTAVTLQLSDINDSTVDSTSSDVQKHVEALKRI